MLKIKNIKIKNFRSIVDIDIDTDKLNIFVGLNDAGKSNVLKALNLFFNGETEPGTIFDFETDYSKYAPIRKKKAKEIIISIIFEVPERYHDKIKTLVLEPTEDMKCVNYKIKNAVIITIEHLLSYDFWKKIKEKGWTEEKSSKEILSMFEKVVDIKKPLDSVIDEMVDNVDMRETIIYLMPKDDKKENILKLVQKEVENGNTSIIEGFKNTILELEKEFK